MENFVSKQKIDFFRGLNFYVPAYQRGYKWRRSDVRKLLLDISSLNQYEFSGEYCLQPIVVAKYPEKGDNAYILVDGQQRLTTLMLILKLFENEAPYNINYETRDESNDFLEKFIKGDSYSGGKTCDVHFFENAIEEIKTNSFCKENFLNNLSKVVMIWYLVDKDQGAKHFERLNSKKIGLTNTELAKALFLTKAPKDYRGQLSHEWDMLEYSLRRDDMFSFICPVNSGYNKAFNRIEMILDIYANTRSDKKEDDGSYQTFCVIDDNIKNVGVLKVWKEIISLHHLIESWYSTPFLYNLIGFLVIEKGTDYLFELYDPYRQNIPELMSLPKTEERVLKSIFDYINKGSKEKTEKWLRELQYHNPDTRNVLLLFNILSMMAVKSDVSDKDVIPHEKFIFHDKFHFDLFKIQGWDKEHIHATASESLTDPKEWKEWIYNIDFDILKQRIAQNPEYYFEQLGYLESIKKHMVSLLNDEKQGLEVFNDYKVPITSKEDFSQIYKMVLSALDENSVSKDEAQHNSIGNLALLDARTNRSYKAAPFSTKRNKILERIKEGAFVPVGTQNTFMKLYTRYPGEFYHWTKEGGRYGNNEKSDSEYVLDELVNTITKIWPKN